MSKKRSRDPTVTINGIEYPTVTINGIEYAKQQICDETIDLIKEKKPYGMTFPPTQKNEVSYNVICNIENNRNFKEAGASSVICTLPGEKLLRVTIKKETFEAELNGLIIQYCLSNSEHICKVYEFGFLLDTENGEKVYVYAILEYLPKTFYDYLSGKRDVSVKPQIKQLLEAIDFLHSQNVSHLDIKPQNIGFNSHGQLKIFDFGLAVINGYDRIKRVFNKDHPEGTFQYMDPFYFYSHIHSNISDVYSVGVILFEIFFELSGEWSYGQPLIHIYWEPWVLCGHYGMFKCESWKEFVLRSDMRKHPDINPSAKIESLKTLLYGMLQPNPMFRMTAAEALSDTWLNQHSGGGKHNLTSKRRRTGTRNKRRK